MIMRKADSTNHKSAPDHWVYGSLALSLLLAAVALPLHAQSRTYDRMGFPERQMQDPMTPTPTDPATAEMQVKRIRALNADRQKLLISDTVKLVKLTADLNAQINSTHPQSLTDDQLRMVAEIEKLAHDIREKMSSPVNVAPLGGPSLAPPPMMMPPGMP